MVMFFVYMVFLVFVFRLKLVDVETKSSLRLVSEPVKRAR